jgi:hypothetical protein
MFQNMGLAEISGITHYRSKSIEYDPSTIVPELGINWMSRFQERHPSILAM